MNLMQQKCQMYTKLRRPQGIDLVFDAVVSSWRFCYFAYAMKVLNAI